MFERIRELCKEVGISVNDLEERLGYSKNTLYRLKNQIPGSDKVIKIADYFNISTDYLLGRSEIKNIITSVHTNDIEVKLRQILSELETNENLEYNGKSITEIEKSNIEVALKIVIGINESSEN